MIPKLPTPPDKEEKKMKQTWILQAITAGGTLTVKSAIPGRTMLRAQMDWPGEQPITGGIGLTLTSAIESLEEKLMEDCAEEMRKKGVA